MSVKWKNYVDTFKLQVCLCEPLYSMVEFKNLNFEIGGMPFCQEMFLFVVLNEYY